MTIVEQDRPLALLELEQQRPLIEYFVGRPLRRNEQAIDVLGIDTALNAAKEDLDLAIKAEQKRAVKRALRARKRIELDLTAAILAPLERLFRLGRREAYAELQRQGYEPRRAYIAEPQHPELLDHTDTVAAGLHGLSIKLERARLNLEVEGDLATDAIARALLKVPGARAIAAASISRGFTAGLQQTFEANQDLVRGWEYTAVNDIGTCDVCGPLDGTEYATLDELFTVLPGFGPNPFCLGGDRCRCRAIPIGADG